MRKELSACVVQKFDGYEMLRNHLNYGETKDFIPIDIVYKPTLDTKKTILCYFAPFIHLGFHANVEKLKCCARQCHYCNNYFVKSPEKMKKHLSCCSGKAGCTFSFDNGKIIDYQDHYKNLEDVSFGIYYDFEITTGSIVFFDAKMFVVSYCMVVAFHPDLDLPRICIFRSYDLTHEQLTSLSHFEALQYIFFADKKHYNRTTLKQLEDAAFSVQNREKNTALAEMFSIELKFTVDCLKFWFQKNRKVIELSVEEKAYYKQKNPKTKGTICCLCDFPLQARAKNGWCDHAFKAEHLFLENIYSEKEMKRMEMDSFEIYCEKLNKILGEPDSLYDSIESENLSASRSGEQDPEIENIINRTKIIKTSREDEGKATKEKTIVFLYHMQLI